MILIGAYYPNSKHNEGVEASIQDVARCCFSKSHKIHSNQDMFIVSGKISDNDYDVALEHSRKILFGRVFNKATYEEFNENNLRNARASDISKKWWGKYIFFESHVDGKTTVTRDPTGQLPFFYTQINQDLVLFSSELELLVKLLPSRPSYDWPYLLSNILYNHNSHSNRTAFQSVYELPPGCSVNLQKPSQIELTWNPIEYINAEPIKNLEIIQTLESSLKSWVSNYKNIVLSFSGGLDSSALIYALSSVTSADQNLVPVNFYHPDIISSDERKHAHQICSSLNHNLLEINLEDCLPFSPLKKPLSFKPNHPFAALTHLALGEKMTDIVHSYPSSIALNGQGGDHIFLANPPPSLIIDYIRDKGLTGFQKHLQNVSDYYRTTHLQIFKSAAREYRNICSHGRSVVYDENSANWMTEDFLNLGKNQFLHPVQSIFSKEIPVGKVSHIIEIDHGIASVALELGNHNPVYCPFLYQPMIELALKIPTYSLTQNGYDRFPLRQAISQKYGTNHVWRRNKGETTGIVQFGAKQNLNYLMDLCLEGTLSMNGFIDRALVESTLKNFSKGGAESLWPLMNLISTEIFFEMWN